MPDEKELKKQLKRLQDEINKLNREMLVCANKTQKNLLKNRIKANKRIMNFLIGGEKTIKTVIKEKDSLRMLM